MQQEVTIRDLYDLMVSNFSQVNARLDGVESRLESVELRLDKVESRLESVELRLDKVESRLESVELRLDKVESRQNKMEDQLEDIRHILFDYNKMFLQQSEAIYSVGREVLAVGSKLREVELELGRHGKILEEIETQGSFLRARFFKTMAIVTAAISLLVSGSFNFAFSK